MKHLCKNCGAVGKITGTLNATNKTKFIASQWYKDNHGLIHTLLICCECGAFLDCKISPLKMLLMFFTRSYITINIITIDKFIEHAIRYKEMNPALSLHESFKEVASVGSSTVDYLIEKNLLPEEFKDKQRYDSYEDDDNDDELIYFP